MQQLVLLIIGMIFIIGCSNNEISDIKDNEQMLTEREKIDLHIQSAKNNDYKLITALELKNRLDDNDDIQIIAVVPRGIYILGFIKGAKNFEFNNEFSGIWENDANDKKDKFIEFLGNKEKEIILYDTGESNAITAAIWAKKLGYSNVSILIGGFKEWRDKNFEISFDIPECCQI